jgi:hypothetical protein
MTSSMDDSLLAVNPVRLINESIPVGSWPSAFHKRW